MAAASYRFKSACTAKTFTTADVHSVSEMAVGRSAAATKAYHEFDKLLTRIVCEKRRGLSLHGCVHMYHRLVGFGRVWLG